MDNIRYDSFFSRSALAGWAHAACRTRACAVWAVCVGALSTLSTRVRAQRPHSAYPGAVTPSRP